MLIDISGFTQLSERMAVLGKPGTEGLIDVLNDFFGAMLEIVQDFGGDVLKFGGDALLLVFYDTIDQSENVACSCAQAVLRELKTFKSIDTLVGNVTIGVKIVISTGQWFEALVGDERRSELILSGLPLKNLTIMEDIAQSGEIWLNGTLLSKRIPKPPLTEKPLHPSIETKNVIKFLPSGVLNFLKTGMFGEYRAVTTVFINFYGYDEVSFNYSAVNAFIVTVNDIVEKYHGSLNKIDIYHEGSKLLLTFGAPISHEKATVHAILSILELSLRVTKPLELKIGISTGFVYAGTVGSDFAQEYTIIGDAVNLAARLSNTAESGKPVVSETTKRIVEDVFEFEALPAVKLKGKTEPVKRYVPLTWKVEKYYHFDFVGRTVERTQLINAVRTGNSVITITGPAGIGKSRLIHECIKDFPPFCHVLREQCDELKGSFSWFGQIVSNEAGIKPSDPASAIRKKLEDHIRFLDQDQGELLQRLPFIGAMLFNLTYPGSIYDHLTPRIRFENLCDALRLYFTRRTDRSIVLVIDDAHLFTSDDMNLINSLIRSFPDFSQENKSISLILASRLKPDILSQLSKPSDSAPQVIRLGRLDKDACNLITRQLLNNKPLTRDVRLLIETRTEGNPFYIEQFLLHCIEKKLIRETATKWVKGPYFDVSIFPENIWTAVMARVDKLEALTKECLRVGSVIGMEFTEKVVGQVLEQEVASHLAYSVKEELTFQKTVLEAEYIFRHALIKDVIYDSILRKRREKLHNSIGTTIEHYFKHNLEKFLGVLAHHFSHAKAWEKALHYNIEAGNRAMNDFRGAEAIIFLSDAISIIQQKFKRRKTTLAKLYEKLGILYDRTAQFDNAVNAYRKMTSALPHNVLNTCSSHRCICTILEKQAQYDEAIHLIEHTYPLFEQLKHTLPVRTEKARLFALDCWLQRMTGNMDAALSRGLKAIELGTKLSARKQRMKNLVKDAQNEASSNLAGVYLDLSQNKKAIQLYNLSLQINKKADAKMNLPSSLNNLGLVYAQICDYKTAKRYFQDALIGYQEIGFKFGHCEATCNLGTIYAALGHYDAAFDCFQNYLTISQKIQNEAGIGIAYGNIGDIYRMRGEYDRAIDLYRLKLENSCKINYKRGQGVAYLGMGTASLDRRECKTAATYFKKARKIFTETRSTPFFTDLYFELGRLTIMQGGSLRAAEHYARQTLHMSRTHDLKSDEARALLLLGRISIKKIFGLKQRGRKQKYLKISKKHYQQCITVFRKINEPYNVAQTMHEYGLLLKQCEDSAHRKYIRQAAELFKKMNMKPEHKTFEHIFQTNESLSEL